MTNPALPPIPPAVVNPLQWQISHGQAPDGTKICVLVLNQGVLAVQLGLNLYDIDKLGRGLVDAAAQAKTGLILPAGTVITPNGGS